MSRSPHDNPGSFRADWFPPDIEPGPDTEEIRWDGGHGAIRGTRHVLDPAALARIATGLRSRADAFRRVPAGRIRTALAAVHGRWSAPASEERRRAVRILASVTGYPEPVLDESLRDLFAGMDSTAMEGWLHAAGIQPGMLDDTPGLSTLVFGPALTVVIGAGNIPGAALPSVVQALLLKSPCLVKASSSEPYLIAAYARSLAAEALEVARALAAASWQGGRTDLEDALLPHADALIAYGSDATLESLRARLAVHARFLGYGHRISFAGVGRELLDPRRIEAAAAAAAQDLALFDQQGCLSPQALFVEAGGALGPEEFGDALALALTEVERELSRRPISSEEAAAIHQYRAAVEMRSFSDESVRLWASPEGTAWTVALERGGPLEPCVLNRVAVLRPIADLSELPARIAPLGPRLMSASLGVGAVRISELAASLGGAGVKRVTVLGQAQRPLSALYHDGISAVAHLARYVTVESVSREPE